MLFLCSETEGSELSDFERGAPKKNGNFVNQNGDVNTATECLSPDGR